MPFVALKSIPSPGLPIATTDSPDARAMYRQAQDEEKESRESKACAFRDEMKPRIRLALRGRRLRCVSRTAKDRQAGVLRETRVELR
jgi:hypothetical protein